MIWNSYYHNPGFSTIYSAESINRREGKNPKGGTGKFMSEEKKIKARKKRRK